jgi:hypothetical protein
MKVLLDTNAYTQLMHGEPRVAALVRRSEQVVENLECMHGWAPQGCSPVVDSQTPCMFQSASKKRSTILF